MLAAGEQAEESGEAWEVVSAAVGPRPALLIAGLGPVVAGLAAWRGWAA